MKKALLAAATVAPLLIPAQAAHAADYGLAPSSYDWNGGYVGVTAGMGFNMTDFKNDYRYVGGSASAASTVGADANAFDFSATGDDARFAGGVLAGYNWQFSNFVLGLEGDFNYIGFNGQVSHNADQAVSNIFAEDTSGVRDTIDYSADWFGTVRGRLGYAIDNFLVYGTGGMAYGKLELDRNLSAAVSPESIRWSGRDDGWQIGWTLGGGMEYGIDRWTLGVEYLYVDLGSYDWSAMPSVALDSANAAAEGDWKNVEQSGSADYRFGLARASLKYRF